ncbi:hypothetical protein [Halorubrum sp. Atlit-26R]|uniref:hypothetical protein n=1 Tax=Halorubrum sp. Atlit-26R TaxID=2282128 RepID=UPI000EF1E6C1|nr:hypothetical protein [Halorubrum sp. Atlit-26R]RLM68560.1 hypothetical protein DVK07_10590 [Halorubrum sp. Atlit-26R]
MSQALMEAVVESATEDGSESASPYSVDTGVFERFDARLEDLYWREGPDGALYASEEEQRPSFAVRIEVEGTELSAETVKRPRFGRSYRIISGPETNTSPQFD